MVLYNISTTVLDSSGRPGIELLPFSTMTMLAATQLDRLRNGISD